MIQKHIEISGMSCHHCVMAVKKELSTVEGLTVDDVQIGSATVTYDPSLVDDAKIVAAVEEAGYHVRMN